MIRDMLRPDRSVVKIHYLLPYYLILQVTIPAHLLGCVGSALETLLALVFIESATIELSSKGRDQTHLSYTYSVLVRVVKS